jgi:hypothetical protein
MNRVKWREREREREMMSSSLSPQGSTFQWGACLLSSIMGQSEGETPFFCDVQEFTHKRSVYEENSF